jgi:hypothetical protein
LHLLHSYAADERDHLTVCAARGDALVSLATPVTRLARSITGCRAPGGIPDGTLSTRCCSRRARTDSSTACWAPCATQWPSQTPSAWYAGQRLMIHSGVACELAS